MELVNNNYVKVDKFDLCFQQIQASEQGDKFREVYFNKIMSNLIDYEKEQKRIVSEFYMSTDDLYIKGLLEKSEIQITRQTVLNALVFATVNNDVEVSRKLISLIAKKKFSISELGDLLNYVLSHSMDINEFFDEEDERVIYNNLDSKFEKGYIFETNKIEKNKRLKLN